MVDIAATLANVETAPLMTMEANDDGGVGGAGGGGGPGKYIGMIKSVGAWAASVSAQAGAASAWSGAMQSAASKVGS